MNGLQVCGGILLSEPAGQLGGAWGSQREPPAEIGLFQTSSLGFSKEARSDVASVMKNSTSI